MFSYLKTHFDIVGSEPNIQTQKSTVCFCIALRDKDGYVKKFAFHNGAHVMSPAMRTKAHESGYDVIQVEQSHAEGQFLQFLLHRHRKRPGLHTHIMGMGCSRRHCSECDHFFKMFLGNDYHQVTASGCEKNEKITLPMTNKDEWDDLLGGLRKVSTAANVNTAPTSFKPTHDTKVTITTPGTVSGQDSIEDKTYPHYYLPDILQEFVRRITGKNYDFSNPRFTKSTEEAVKKRTRRRNSKETQPAG